MDDLSGCTETQILRRQLRAQRRATADEVRERASLYAGKAGYEWLRTKLGALSLRRIGVFVSLPEEIDTQPLILRLWPTGAQLFLPVVHAPDAPLHWQAYKPNTVLVRDALGIAAPRDAQTTRLPAMALDAVVVPLVGWDRSGWRIGMGGGFYDRTFAAKIAARPPYLLGYAYANQEVRQGITPKPWDIRLDGVVSESASLFFTGVEHGKTP